VFSFYEQLEMKSTTISSNLLSAKVQDDCEASSFVALVEDYDCKNKEFMFFCHMTKWIIYKD